MKLIDVANALHLGNSQQTADYFNIRASVQMINRNNENVLYKVGLRPRKFHIIFTSKLSTKKVVKMFDKTRCNKIQACPKENCNKKVVELGPGSYRCEKCNEDTDRFKYRALLSVSLI